MTWTRLDDGFSDHPKVMKVTPLAELLQVRALQYANRYLTDGHIGRAALPSLARGMAAYRERGRLVTAEALAEQLVAAGIWDRAMDGYQVHDFLVYQNSREKVLGERAAARERMAKLRGSA